MIFDISPQANKHIINYYYFFKDFTIPPDSASFVSSISNDHRTFLEGVIVLEEFCKELAAIVFVKDHASSLHKH